MASPPPLSSNTLGLQLLQSIWIEFAIATFVVAARLYVRTFMVRRVGWDDVTMTTALLTTLGMTVLITLAVSAGFGQHARDLDPALAVEAVKWIFLGEIFGIMCCAFARMAFIITLLCLVSPTQRIQIWLLRAFFLLQVCVNAITALLILLECRPVYGLWDHTVESICLSPSIRINAAIVQGAVNSFSDLALAIFPATIIWKLNLKLTIKVSLCVTMGLGVLAFATCIVKTVYLAWIGTDSDDLTYTMFTATFWFSVENSTIIVSATIPTLRPLFTRTRASKTTSYDAKGEIHQKPLRRAPSSAGPDLEGSDAYLARLPELHITTDA